jgi:hypothetical protein
MSLQHPKYGFYVSKRTLLYQLRFLDSELQECVSLPRIFEIYNYGGLAVVNEAFLPWATRLLQLIQESFNLQTLNADSLKNTSGAIANDYGLYNFWQQGLSTLKSSSVPMLTPSNVATSVHQNLISKTLHARGGAILKMFNEKEFGRFDNKSGSMGLREHLKGASGVQRTKAAHK